MTSPDRSQTRLPLKGSLTLISILSLIITLLMAAAAILGILNPGAVYPAEDLLQSFLPTDVATLIIGVPMLLLSIFLTRRAKLIGLLFWPGALLFVLYNYLVYVLAMPLNPAFLLHLALVTLSVYALIGLVSIIDIQAVQTLLTDRVPARFGGGVLAGLGTLFTLRVAVALVGALMDKTPLAASELALHISDFLVSPAWVIVGVLLWQRKPFGYLAGLGMLFQASMLFIGLIIFLFLQPSLTGAPFAPVDILVVFVMGLICFIPFGLYIRGVLAAQSHP